MTETNITIINQSQPAGLLRRVAAGLIDVTLVFAFLIAASYFTDLLGFSLGFVAQMVVIAFYFTSFSTMNWQATLGKRVCNIYVATKDNQKLSFQRALAKYFTLITIFVVTQLTVTLYITSMDKVVKLLQSSNNDLKVILAITYTITFFTTISFIFILFSSIIFTKRKALLHDVICGTRVFVGRK